MRLFCSGVPVKTIRRRVCTLLTHFDSADESFFSTWPSSHTIISAPAWAQDNTNKPSLWYWQKMVHGAWKKPSSNYLLTNRQTNCKRAKSGQTKWKIWQQSSNFSWTDFFMTLASYWSQVMHMSFLQVRLLYLISHTSLSLESHCLWSTLPPLGYSKSENGGRNDENKKLVC